MCVRYYFGKEDDDSKYSASAPVYVCMCVCVVCAWLCCKVGFRAPGPLDRLLGKLVNFVSGSTALV